MISVDFSSAVALFMSLCVAAVFFAWLLKRKGRDKDLTLDSKFIWFCSICTYTYINTKEELISVCPRCGNYNKKDAAASLRQKSS